MLPYIRIHRPIHNVVEPILLTGQKMLRVTLSPSCQLWQKKLRKSGNDYAQSQPHVNQEWLKKCSMKNFNRFNQNWFRLKRLIPIERDLSLLHIHREYFNARTWLRNHTCNLCLYYQVTKLGKIADVLQLRCHLCSSLSSKLGFRVVQKASKSNLKITVGPRFNEVPKDWGN